MYPIINHVKKYLKFSQAQLAEALSMSPQKLAYQLKTGKYNLDDINEILIANGCPPYKEADIDILRRCSHDELVDRVSKLLEDKNRLERQYDDLMELHKMLMQKNG